jgi:kynureninase
MKRITFAADEDCARALDEADGLAPYRRRFHLPRAGDGPLIYLSGHSLGLLPKRGAAYVERELERWRRNAVEAHFTADGWYSYHERFAKPLARLTGARQHEVVAMNSLTVNLHLLLVSFFRPTARRSKILMERGAFPSDRYAVESQLRFHGLEPATSLIELAPPSPNGRLTPDVLEQRLARDGESVALVLLPGVQYRTGEALDITGLTAVAQRYGCCVGFDLAHAIGNLPLALHRSNVDFAVWCSYKYLNGGPGAVGGCFVHERHAEEYDRPRLAGWWGHDKKRRFRMEREFRAMRGAEGWQLSNPPILAMAPLEASLEIFDAAGLTRLREKSRRMGRYVDFLLAALLSDRVEILTPSSARSRGAQVSLRLARASADATTIAARLRSRRIVVDTREPDILRLAPVPLYNRFRDVFAAIEALQRAL